MQLVVLFLKYLVCTGSLFSVVDDAGVLYSINDVNDVPIFTVDSDKSVNIYGNLYLNSAYWTGLTTSTYVYNVDKTTGCCFL